MSEEAEYRYHEGFYNQIELQDTKQKRWGYHICDSSNGRLVAIVFEKNDVNRMLEALNGYAG